MKRSRFELALVVAASVAACTPQSSGQPSPVGTGTVATTNPSPAPQTAAGAAGATGTGAPEGQRGPGGPGGPPAGRRPPNPMAQDTMRRKVVDSILVAIAGRENEPAGTVFKNVKILKDMPAGEFVRNMDVTYGRGL